MSFLETLLIHQKRVLSSIKTRRIKEPYRQGQGALGNKWTHERVGKVSDKTINKRYAEYRQRELNEKGKKLGEPWASISLICIRPTFLRWLRSGMFTNYAKTLRMIQSLRISLGCLLVCTFGNFLAHVLVTAHTINNLDLYDEHGYENEGYEGEKP